MKDSLRKGDKMEDALIIAQGTMGLGNFAFCLSSTL